jgi:hypothetical protein
MNSLARIFKVDVQAMTNATRSFAQTVEHFSDSMEVVQDITTSSDVTGLIGVQSEYGDQCRRTD